MVGAGEHEADTDLLYAPADLLRPESYLGPEGFEDVRRARLARGGPVAMLGDHDARSPRHERRRRRDVDGPLRVAAGAAGVDDAFGGLDSFGEAAHGAGEAHDLPDRLAPHP